ncbi:MAG TPA: hypothetical protein PK122_05470 [Candidatus Paceibacterota bacterium]|nr:hypothetical protein [Candidatus Paceibacterota bacterium]
MEEQIANIEHYVKLLNDAMGIKISVRIKGTLGIIMEEDRAIFTTSGTQSTSIIEAYLMGFVTALTR